MTKISWEKDTRVNVKDPKVVSHYNVLRVYMPLSLDKVIIMPGEDALIPTGLIFPGLYKDYVINLVHHSYPNEKSDLLGIWKGKLRDRSVFHNSICLDDTNQLFIHIINLGNKEIIFEPGDSIGLLSFSKIIEL